MGPHEIDGRAEKTQTIGCVYSACNNHNQYVHGQASTARRASVVTLRSTVFCTEHLEEHLDTQKRASGKTRATDKNGEQKKNKKNINESGD